MATTTCTASYVTPSDFSSSSFITVTKRVRVARTNRQLIAKNLIGVSVSNRLKILNEIKNFPKHYEFFGLKSEITDSDLKYLNYLIAVHIARRDAGQHHRQVVAAKQAARRAEWFSQKRAVVYRKNHPFGELSHDWLNYKINRITKMQTGDGFDKSSDEITRCCELDCLYRLTKLGLRPICLDDATVVSTKKQRRVEVPLPKWNKTFKIFQSCVPASRDQFLILKLRSAVALLAERRSRRGHASLPKEDFQRAFIKRVYKNLPKSSEVAQHQGIDETDGAHGDSEGLTVDQAGNVALTRQSEESKGAPESVNTFNTFNMATSDQHPQYDAFMDRYILLDTFNWKDAKTQGDEVASYSLPYDLVKSREKSPNMAFFRLYQYVKCDMEIKVQVNAQPMAQGQLQVSWKYMDDFDNNAKWYNNIQSLSQTDHILITANDENPGCLYIPYRYVKPSLSTTVRSDQDKPLRMGKLYIKVLNPLYTSATTCADVDVSIWVRFLNGQFSGMTSRDVGKFKAEHEGIWENIKDAEFHLNVDAKLHNKDKPPVQGASQQVVIQSNQSYSAGTNSTEPINSLRLDMRGQGANIEQCSDDTKISKISRVFGFVRTLNWHVCDTAGKLLTTIDASPMFNLNEYAQGVEQTDRYFNLPPVAVLSEMFLYWRGSLELRIDAIATAFHKGKLMVCYVPRVIENITMQQALGCPHVIFDLSQQKQFSFTVPWITNQHYWSRRFGVREFSDQVQPPGKIYIFIQNKLSKQDNVRDIVHLNLYWRGGPDFSVAVPATSALSLPWNPAESSTGNVFRAGPGYAPFYVGTWRYLYGDRPILRYGTGADHVAQFINCPKIISNSYFKYNIKDGELGCNDSSGNWIKFYFGVLLADADSGKEYRYMVMCRTEDEAKKYLDYQKYPEYKKHPVDALALIRDDDKGSWGGKENLTWEEIDYEPIAPPKPPGVSEQYVMINLAEHQGEKDSLEAPTINLATNNIFVQSASNRTFGENFTDLKDLCRRYQPYTSIELTTNQYASPVDKILPIAPCGLKLGKIDGSKPADRYKFLKREGHIPLICSGYRFFRGGLRFRLPVAHSEAQVFMTHLPEKQGLSDIESPKANSFDAYYSPTYASYVQSTHVNPVISIEVPYYNFNNSIFPNHLTTASVKEMTGLLDLGALAIGASSQLSQVQTTHGILFYSFADDAILSCFQGFPSMILRAENFKETVVQHQGFLDWFNFQPTVKVDLGLKEVLESKQFQDLNDTFKSFGITTTQALINQIVHVAINPDIKTVAWAIVSILIQLKIFSFEYFSQLVPLFEKLTFSLKSFGFCNFNTSPHQPDQQRGLDQANHQAISDETITEIAQLIATFFSVLTMCVGVVNAKTPKSFIKYAAILLGGITAGAKSYQSVLALFINVLKLVKKFTEYITMWLHPELVLEKLVNEDLPVLQLWTDEVTTLLNIENEDKVYTQGSVWAERMEVAYTLGCKIQKHIVDYKGEILPACQLRVFTQLFKQLCEKRDQMYRRGRSVVARKDPFCVYFAGDPGIGKSIMATKFTTSLLREAGIPVVGEPIFTLPNGAKYWNGCRNQPAILIDDFLCVNAGTIQEEAIRAFFEIKSAAILNPPMASLTEKDLRYAPQLVTILSNSAFPIVNHANLEAIYRRRDVLVKTTLIPQMVNAGLTRLSGQTRDELEAQFNVNMLEFEHLQFYIAGDVTGGIVRGGNASEEAAQFGRPLTYREFFRRVLRQFEDHEQNQEILYQMRVDDLNDFIEEDIDEMVSLTDKLEEFRRIIRFMGELPVKPNANYKDYLRLIQMVANNEPVTDERIAEVVDIRERTMANFRRIQEERRRATAAHAENADAVGEGEVIPEQEAEHQGKLLGTGKYSKTELEKNIKHSIEYCLNTSVAYYCKESKIQVKRKERTVEKYVKHHTALKYESVIKLMQHRFQLLKNIEYDIRKENISHLILHVNEKPTYDQYKIGLQQFNESLVSQQIAPYCPAVIECEADYTDDNFQQEVLNLFVHAFNATCHFTLYLEKLESIFNESFFSLGMMDQNIERLGRHFITGLDDIQFSRFLYVCNLFLFKHCKEEEKFKAIFKFDRLYIARAWSQLFSMTFVWFLQNCFDQDVFQQHWEAYAEVGQFNMNVPESVFNYIKVFEMIVNQDPFHIDTEIGRIMRGFDCETPSVRSCSHILFTPLCAWDGTSWITKTVDFNGSKIAIIPNEPCERECMWKSPHLLRFTAQLWKFNNPTTFKLIMRGTHHPYLFKTPKDIDPTFFEKLTMKFEKGWYWLKVIAVITLTVLVHLIIILLPLIIFLLKIYLISKTMRFIFGERFIPPSTEMPEPNFPEFNSFHQSYNQEPPRPHQKNYYQNMFFSKGNHQGTFNDNVNQLISVITTNTYWVADVNGGSSFRVTCLGGTVFLFLKHYFEYFKAKGTTELCFTRCGSEVKYTVRMDAIGFHTNPHNSGGIAEVTYGLPLHKHIFRRFQPLRNIKNTPKIAKFLEAEITHNNIVDVNLVRHPGVVVAESGPFSEQVLSDIYKYNYGGPGKCGSLLIDPISCCILGVHVAGKDSLGYAEVYCIDSFISFFQSGENSLQPATISFVDEEKKPNANCKGNFVYLGRVQDGLNHHQSGATQIQRTLIHGTCPVYREPAPLAKGDPRVPIENYSPLWAGVEKMKEPTKDFPQHVLKRAFEDLNNKILLDLEPIYMPIQPLTYYEAIMGIPGMKYYDALDFTTSEGFPLSKFRPKEASNKGWLFDRTNPENIGIHEYLEQMLKMEANNRVNGICMPVVHEDCLKDALIPKEKISKPGKTRIFSVSPVQFTIAFKQYFNHFLAAFKTQRIKFEHAIGIPTNGFEWGMVVRYLTERGATKIVTGDYSNFGPGLNTSVLEHAFQIMINWCNKHYNYNKTYTKVMQVMKYEVCHAVHLAQDVLYEVQCGLPSGNPATVELNSMVNMLYIRCAWLEIMKNCSGYRYFMDHYHLHVRLLTYGDDLIFSVSDQVAEYFNSETLHHYFKKYNIVYTDATKSGDIKKWDTLQNSQFLKRSFQPHPEFHDQWLAPLDWNCVMDTSNWCKKYLSLEDGTRESVCATLSEAYGHGPERYEQLRSILQAALTEAGIFASLRTWDDWDSIHFSQFYG